jgi:hypothetical protein
MSDIALLRVRLFGGLGNQFFQYFAGLDAATKSKMYLEVDCRWIEASYSQEFSDIRDFNLFSETRTLTLQDNGKFNFTLERLKTKLSLVSHIAASIFGLDTPRGSGYTEIHTFQKNLELRGYYQSYKYFKDVSSQFGPIDWSLRVESDSYNKIRDYLCSKPFIAIHIRGGDYLKKSKIYCKLDYFYYAAAIEELQSKLGVIKVIVFSDDDVYARDILGNISGLEFINQKGLRASEAMLLMSLAKGIVIANSTFSYWAAMINCGGNVIAPKNWYETAVVDEDFYPSHWKIV